MEEIKKEVRVEKEEVEIKMAASAKKSTVSYVDDGLGCISIEWVLKKGKEIK